MLNNLMFLILKSWIENALYFFQGKSVISHLELIDLVEKGVINAPIENINQSSIDLTLHWSISTEEIPYGTGEVSIAEGESIAMKPRMIDKAKGYSIAPGEFILASTNEIFNLPDNISAEYKLKSSMARNGQEHLNAGWIDAGFNGRLTLEFKNMTRFHSLNLQYGMKCGQVVFFRHKRVPRSQSYAIRGRYNEQKTATESKGIK